MKIDFERVRAELLARGFDLVAAWLPGGHRAGPEWVCGGLRGEPGRSLSVNTSTGVWTDFATGEKGADLISLFAAIHGLRQGEAAQRLIDELRLQSDPAPRRSAAPALPASRIGPPPAGTGLPDSWRTKAGQRMPLRVDHLYAYRSAAGDLLCCIGRIDARGDDPKRILQISWDLDAGEWVGAAYPSPRPLYGLDRLAAAPDLPVLVLEGEKAVDAVRDLLADHFVAVTWPGGSKAVARADWSPLLGRAVVLWPDADAPGAQAMDAVAALLAPGGGRVGRVSVVGQAKGWDAADAVADGWDAARLRELITAASAAPPPSLPARTAAAPPAVMGPVIDDRDAPASAAEYRATVRAWVAYVDEAGLRPDANCGWLLQGQAHDLGTDDLVARFVHRRQLLHARLRSDDVATCTAVTIADWRQERRSAILGALIGRPSTDQGRAALAALVRAWTGGEDPLHVAVLAHWLWQVKRRAAGLGVEWDLMPVLVGRQGSGKTTEIARLCAVWHELSAPVTATQIVDPREAPLLARALVGVWDEMSGASRADGDALKRAVSQAQAAFRRLHTHDYEVRRRTVTFIGSSNFPLSIILRDTSGARRFAEIPASSIDWDEAAQVDPAHVWAAVSEHDPAPILAQLDALRQHQRTLIPFDLIRAWQEDEASTGWPSLRILRADQQPVIIPPLDPPPATPEQGAQPGGWSLAQIAQRIAHFGRGFGRGTVAIEQLRQRLLELGWSERQVRVGHRAQDQRQRRWFLDPAVRQELAAGADTARSDDQGLSSQEISEDIYGSL